MHLVCKASYHQRTSASVRRVDDLLVAACKCRQMISAASPFSGARTRAAMLCRHLLARSSMLAAPSPHRQRLPPPFTSTRPRVLSNENLPRADSGEGPPSSKLSMPTELYAYLLDHTREQPVMRRLREETAGMHGSQMQIPPEQGPFMALLARLIGARKAIEIGVFTGSSSLSVAMALPDDGILYACDKDDSSMSVARRYWQEAGVEHKIRERLGDGKATLQDLIDEGNTNTFDLAFIDANKRAYVAYYELLMKLVRPGGLIIADNVLFYGKVANQQVQDKYTKALRDFNDHVYADKRIELSIIPVGDGMALCRKLHD